MGKSSESQTVNKFPAVELGASIGVWAPSSPANPERLKAGIKNIENLGYKVNCPIDPSKNYLSPRLDFASGSVEERKTAFEVLLNDPAVKAIIAVRGAYGSAQLLPFINFDLFASNPKPIIGYSDITALLMGIYSRTKLPVIHGPTVSKEFAEIENLESKTSVDHLLRLIGDPGYRPEFDCHHIVRQGGGKGNIICGNLTMLLSILGTSWDTSYDMAILVLEDVNEAPYRIHRLLIQLKLAGKFENIAGLVLGRFSQCEAKNGPKIQEILTQGLLEIVKGTNFPILSGLDFGHNGKNYALPLGVEAEIKNNKLRILESPVFS